MVPFSFAWWMFSLRNQGGLAKRLCSGLQIRLERFDSATRLHIQPVFRLTFKSSFPTTRI